jgi:hypothetical protein
MPSSDYKQAYESAKRELAELVATQDKIANRILKLRESLKAFASLCESEEVPVEPSAEAAYLLENSTLAQEIKAVLQSQWPVMQRPHHVKEHLERLGIDLTGYSNPQAAIHMVLKRMAETGEAEKAEDTFGKQAFRCPPTGIMAALARRPDIPLSPLSDLISNTRLAGIAENAPSVLPDTNLFNLGPSKPKDTGKKK